MDRVAIIRLAVLFGVGLTVLAARLPDSPRRGRALFYGKQVLTGKIRDHDEDLPSEALRCSNCHESKSGGLDPVSAPHLDGSLLLENRQRRGGPPSRYDSASFCKLLRTGTDPAFIVIARTMPVYKLNEEQCNSLWAFVTEKNTRNDKK